MHKTWIKRTLSVILTLALAIGVCGMLPAGALAAQGEYQLSPDPAAVTAGGQKTFTVEPIDKTKTPARTPVKYVWTPAGTGNSANEGNGGAVSTYTFNVPGTQTVTCALYDSLDATAVPFETLTAAVTVNEADKAASAETGAPAPMEATPTPTPAEASTPTPVEASTPAPVEGGATGPSGAPGGMVARSIAPYAVTITNQKASITSRELSTGHTLGLDITDGNSASALGDVTSASWKSSNTTIVTISGSSKTGATLKLGSIGMGANVTITVELKIKDSGGTIHAVTESFTIATVVPEIRFTTAGSDMEVGATRNIAVEKYPANAPILFASDEISAVSVNPTTATNANSATIKANALKAGDTTITAWFQNYDRATVSADYVVPNVTGKAPTLNWKQPSVSLVAGNSLNLMSYLNHTSGLALTFTDDSGAGTATVDANGRVTSAAGDSGTLTVSVTSAATGTYKAGGPVTIKVYVGTNYPITVGNSTMKLAVNSSGITAITKGTGAGNWNITTSNSNVATATPNSASDDATVLTIQGYQTGTATITVRAEGSTSYATIYVTVGNPAAGITANFWSSDNSSTTLTKYYNWGTLQISVANYNQAQPYVTVTRSNIRTYVRDGSYTTHPSTYNYTATLYPSSTDPTTGVATLYIIPQYNGSTTYTASYTYASGYQTITAKSPTIHVTGYSTLPQTGPDYTWAYVLGGLCLAAVVTAVTLNVKRKKKQQEN